jgi:glycosyltransferase involved in cell wall biosynthesis
VPPPYGGVSVYVDRIRNRLRNIGVKIWSYPYKPDRQIDTRFFHHRRLGIIPLVFGDGYRARVLDTSHFHLEHPNAILVPLWLILIRAFRIEWIKMIFDGTLPSRYQRFTRVQRLLFRVAARRVAAFMVVHEELAQWLRQEIKITQPVTTIPCLLAPSQELLNRPPPAELTNLLQAYLSAEKRICSIGAFVATYGFKDVAQAVEKLRVETGLELALLLVAGGFAQDDRYRDEVLSGRDWITVLEDVPNEDVFPVLKSSDVFVRGNIEEGYGISRVEAIWCGVPVIATNVGETRGMLTYEFGDIESLKKQLRRTLCEEKPDDVRAASAMFHQEAERNLEDLKRVLGLINQQ